MNDNENASNGGSLEETRPANAVDPNEHYRPVHIDRQRIEAQNAETTPNQTPIEAQPGPTLPPAPASGQPLPLPPPIGDLKFPEYVPVNPPPDPEETRPYIAPVQSSLPRQAVLPAQARPIDRPSQPPARPVNPLPGQPAAAAAPAKAKRKGWSVGGCGCLSILAVALGLALIYFLAPLRTNILILGIDRAADGSYTGRSDTNIVVSIIPLKPTVNMLSIPRDLWVSIPGVGENRINTAHFFAEAAEPGSGPRATLETVRQNFGLTIPYYARIRFDDVLNIVDAMGGVTIHLDEATAGYDPGTYTLDSAQALAFARNRSGTDDFFRMAQGQILIKAIVAQLLSPASWPRLPAILQAMIASVDTNLPVWQWPRVGLALARGILQGTLVNRTIDRSMVTGWTTDQGAQVLLPNWDAINPVLKELFGE